MVMEIQPQGHMRLPQMRTNWPELITHRTRIVAIHKAGKGIREISHLLGISRDTVRLWVRRHQEDGHMLTRPQTGGTRVTTLEEDQQIRRKAERAPLSTAVYIRRVTGVHCHPITTRRQIWETGRQCFIPAC
ncbi:putative winged helix-turn-helix domain containing protein 10 [Homarus americanus]|uniref:Putative winged helix-turn-helix domain containing protein 10 n=1 Tax=Homarus americanus TaxID=6706 RepID=A0A8J5MUS8_HOMAM|nr:putative winged helix-turn-helix domain containing protein 10 [Homarus americanus]